MTGTRKPRPRPGPWRCLRCGTVSYGIVYCDACKESAEVKEERYIASLSFEEAITYCKAKAREERLGALEAERGEE